MGNHRLAGDSDYSLHPPAFISATDPAIAGGTGATGIRSGQWWLEHTGGDADALEALWYRNAANDGWVDIFNLLGGGIGNPGSIATGDVLYGSAVDTISALAAGANGQVLTLAAGIPSWATPIDYGVANPGTIATGDLLYGSAADTLSALGIGSQDQVLTVSAGGLPVWAAAQGGSGLDNPGSAATGDIIYASAADTLAVLNIGTEDQVLTVSASGIPEWAAAAGGGSGYEAGDTILVADGTAAAPGLAFNSDTDTGMSLVAAEMYLGYAGTPFLRGTNLRVYFPLPLYAAGGSDAAPSYAFNGSTNTGMGYHGSELRFTRAGSRIASFGSTYVNFNQVVRVLTAGTAGGPAFTAGTDLDTGWYSGGTNIMSFATAGTERFRIEADGGILFYNLPTSDPSVVNEVWSNSGVLTLSAG